MEIYGNNGWLTPKVFVKCLDFAIVIVDDMGRLPILQLNVCFIRIH